MIVRIVSALMDEPVDSLYRFWLASCVEAFLRGSNPRDQVCCTRLSTSTDSAPDPKHHLFWGTLLSMPQAAIVALVGNVVAVILADT